MTQVTLPLHASMAVPSALVIGLGVTGYSVIRFLHSLGWQLTVMDSRLNPPCLTDVQKNYPNVEICLGHIVYEHFKNYDNVITSPGVALDLQRNQTPIIGDIELFARHADAPVIAITGSNGKSTVTLLVYELLKNDGFKVQMGGNIGYPALNLLNLGPVDFYVLELSSFQLETTYSLAPISSTVLNISEDHMDRYDSLNDYAKVKKSIYKKAKNAVVPHDIKVTSTEYVNVIGFGLDAATGNQDFGLTIVDDVQWISRSETLLLDTSKLSLSGQHNVLNTMAALALIEAAGVEISASMIATAEKFQGLPHRCEVLCDSRGMKWINDSKATNVGATIAAITGLAEPIILILGGQAKGAEFSLLNQYMKNVIQVFIYGEAANQLEQTLKGCVSVKRVSYLAEAVDGARQLAAAENLVLFSPACASFDMFKNYEHRGEVFKSLVRQGSC